ncbi:DUF6000 family protein [uncultured Kordia sp.]|uniref:DUF6000 family protein n=1 Tax=uncultured Kordia sp. TaxID=507699 RepID=UPI0026072488|nr:DUF6000 family protein [uncultured Kordia sp.]
MDDKTKREIELHTAGATVRHKSPFQELESYKNSEKIDPEFVSKWVKPFYMNLNRADEDWIDNISKLSPEISDAVILRNLGDFNWRTRQTGSFFSSIKNKKEFTDIIGTHLLKSEVCYAGREYAVTLSYFNTKDSIMYLNKYLDYYLLHPELAFDQYTVISAVKYLDELNNTNLIANHLDSWKRFLENGKKLQYENHELLLKSDAIPEEAKLKLSEITFDQNIDYNIKTNFIEKKINTIKAIVNKV